MYDYYLGGKDNFPSDRETAEKALSVVPFGREIARANRQFLARAITVMASDGISQFIDLGTGLPTRPNVHELARSVHPGARVLYVERTERIHWETSGRRPGLQQRRSGQILRPPEQRSAGGHRKL